MALNLAITTEYRNQKSDYGTGKNSFEGLVYHKNFQPASLKDRKTPN